MRCPRLGVLIPVSLIQSALRVHRKPNIGPGVRVAVPTEPIVVCASGKSFQYIPCPQRYARHMAWVWGPTSKVTTTLTCKLLPLNLTEAPTGDSNKRADCVIACEDRLESVWRPRWSSFGAQDGQKSGCVRAYAPPLRSIWV